MMDETQRIHPFSCRKQRKEKTTSYASPGETWSLHHPGWFPHLPRRCQTVAVWPGPQPGGRFYPDCSHADWHCCDLHRWLRYSEKALAGGGNEHCRRYRHAARGFRLCLRPLLRDGGCVWNWISSLPGVPYFGVWQARGMEVSLAIIAIGFILGMPFRLERTPKRKKH